MMVISNNCIGGYYYNHMNMQYNNPFIWSCLTYDSIYYLLQNYKNINWYDYSIRKSDIIKDTFILNIQNNIDIHYVHYKFDANATTLQKDKTFDKTKYDFWMGDIKYYKILDFINEKYLTRVNRLIKELGDPIFLIVDNNNFSDIRAKTNSIVDILNSQDMYKKIIITMNPTLHSTSNCKIIYDNVCTHPDILLKRHLTTINEFLTLYK